jgi:hypothetical protein
MPSTDSAINADGGMVDFFTYSSPLIVIVSILFSRVMVGWLFVALDGYNTTLTVQCKIKIQFKFENHKQESR